MKVFFKKILFVPSIAKKITKLLVGIHQFSYRYLGVFASASESGLHPKHRLICYHKFFVENVSKGDRVLDIGCGNGVLLKDIAVKTDAFAVGVDISEENVKVARKTLSDSPKVEIVCSDIWEYNNNNQFETVILSNVLEHVYRRVDLLQYLRMCTLIREKCLSEYRCMNVSGLFHTKRNLVLNGVWILRIKLNILKMDSEKN